MSTGGDPERRPAVAANTRPGGTPDDGGEQTVRAGQGGADRPGEPVNPPGSGERATNALAYPLVGGAAAAVLCVIVLAAVDPSPGRHIRGLLILLTLVALLAVAWGWARTVWYGPTVGRGLPDRDDVPGLDAEHIE